MKTSRGFTLSELLLSLGIAAVIGVIAVPSFFTTSESAAASAAATDIQRALQHARTLAKMQQRRLRVCGSEDGSLCSKRWTRMLLLFDDDNDNKLLDEGELVHQYRINSRHTIIQTRLGLGKKLFSYNGQGRVDFTGSFLVCAADHSPQPLRKITWNSIGRPYVLKSSAKVSAHSTMLCS